LIEAMNLALMNLEVCVVTLGLALLLADLWLPAGQKRLLGYAAAAALVLLLAANLAGFGGADQLGTASGGLFVQDGLAIFFKRFFLVAAILVLILAAEFSDRIAAGVSEYYSLILFALAGMLFAASANHFALLFVSMELITITFYVLTSFQRSRLTSLEAGVKYLILGALSSAIMVYGIALVWGATGKLSFPDLAVVAPQYAHNRILLAGLLLVLVGLGFKIAAVPFQIWVPDVYQGAPTPTTAFLAIGSKAAGFVLLLRVLFTAVPAITARWTNLLIVISALTILYGNLCAIPQRNVKRLLGYSSIAHAGYLLLGVVAVAPVITRTPGNLGAGGAAILYYLSGYLFTVVAAFAVIALVMRHLETEDIAGLAGLDRRSPLLAATMTLSMVSLAGIPPLAGFFGKFLLLKAVIQQGSVNPGCYCLAFTAVAGVVVSLSYYFGVVRTIYWPAVAPEATSIPVSRPMRLALYVCVAGIFYLGIFPGGLVNLATHAVQALTP
jgi:NADH-quinone oxidoreductase subunit N